MTLLRTADQILKYDNHAVNMVYLTQGAVAVGSGDLLGDFPILTVPSLNDGPHIWWILIV